jgi:FtsP/CotA-like multicopper oxidase with cupredoxin domain
MRTAGILTALCAVIPIGYGAARVHAPAPMDVKVNDNRRAAGTMRNDTLTARFTVKLARWAPEGMHHRQVDVAAFTEEGKAPMIPAPLLRVRTGQAMRVTIHNALSDSTLRVFGLWSHPNPGTDKDTVNIAPGGDHEFVFSAGAPGTYIYGARVGHQLGRVGDPERETALGAFVVDSAGPVPPDRVFVLNIWSDSTGNALAINGNSWPGTERIEATTGDTLRWRIVNATGRPHPMHLHGFYYTLLSKGDARADTVYAANMRALEVTNRMRNMSTLTLQWTPNRAGNWLYHCHIAYHVVPEAAQLAAPDSTHDETHSPNAEEHMRGLILGIHVKARRGDRAESRAGARAMRLEVVERTPHADTTHRRRLQYVLGSATTDTTWHPGGPLLLLQVGQPTDITVVNHLHESTAVHWHGLELESYSDGVAGWSGAKGKIAPMIAPADSFVARLSLPRAGTFMYHTHLGDLPQLTSGLYGAIVVLPKGEAFNPALDHVYIAGLDGPEDVPFFRVNGDSTARAPLEMKVGETHRLRMINIMPAADMRWLLTRDSVPVKWSPLAKDGADLPPAMRAPVNSAVRLPPGETRDMLFTPTAAGEYKLRVTVDPALPGWTQRVIVKP